MTQAIQIITGATLFNGAEFLYNHAILIKGEIIAKILPEYQLNINDYPEAKLLKFDGGTISAGFIDIQVNGGGGILLNNQPSVEGIKTIMAGHRKFGTTAMLPTLMSDRFEVMQQAVKAVSQAIEQNVAGIIGLHLEGPFFSMNRRGVHQAQMIREPDEAAFNLYKSFKAGVLMVTLAPEHAPKNYIKRLRNENILVYAGHSDGSYEQMQAALKEGLSGFTHLHNAMTPITAREPGVVGAALEDEDSFVGLILDDIHVAAATAKITINAKKQGKVCIITDAMSSVGTEDNSFELYGETILVKNGKCQNSEGSLAGSALDMAGAVRHCHNSLGFPLAEALRMASIYPATALGLEKQMGLVVEGYQADLVHLNTDLMVTQTAIRGQWE